MNLHQQTFAANRRNTAPPQRERQRKREVVGGATAECAAVVCCVPCAVMDLVVLAAYKVPAGLVKKAMDKKERRRNMQKKKAKQSDALLLQRKQVQVQERQNGVVERKVGPTPLEEHLAGHAAEKSEDVVGLEEEMWAQFNGTGFWRSPSQRLINEQHHRQLKSPGRGGELDRG